MKCASRLLRIAAQLVITALGIVVSLASPSRAEEGDAARDLRARIESTGAAAFIGQQYADPDRWERLLLELERGVSAGDEQWFAVALLLRGATDASRSEGLRFAVARAMAINPGFVISHATSPLSMEDICTVPLIEAEPAEVAGYLNAFDRGLAEIAPGPIRDQGDRCLQRLRAAVQSPM